MPSWRRKQFADLYNFERLIANIFRADVRKNHFNKDDLNRYFVACERMRRVQGVLYQRVLTETHLGDSQEPKILNQ